jgi:hypothetical protein
MITTKFDALDTTKILRDMVGFTNAEKSVALAGFARAEIEIYDRANTAALGAKVPYETFVDGVKSSNLLSVRPDGVIVAEWDIGVELVRWIYTTLREKAPVLKGDYRDSITIFADDRAVADPAGAVGVDQVVIMSTVPYARKLEGVAGKKYMSSQAPDGVFQVVAAMAKRRFSNQAKISYTFRNIGGMTSSLEGWASGRRTTNSKRFGAAKSRRQYEKDTRNPAILIMFR